MGNLSDGRQLFNLIKRINKSAVLEPIPGISHSELIMLENIISLAEINKRVGKTGGARISELSGILKLTPSAVSQTVSKLEEKKLVVRTPCPKDRRTGYVIPLPRAHELAKQAETIRLKKLEKVTELLGKEGTGQLIGLLARLADAMDGKSENPTHPERMNEIR